MKEVVGAGETAANVTAVVDKLMDFAIQAGEKIIIAIVVFVVGRFVVKMVNKLVHGILTRRHVDGGVKTFLLSLTNILLTLLLIISVIGALGVNTTSFAALLASAGVAIGMALSGNLQNFAGGVIILLFKPYKVGDFIDASGQSGTVKEIQIFHTILLTPDNKTIYIPNGTLSNGVVINYSRMDTRRVDFVFGVEYGSDFDFVKQTLMDILNADERILKDPAPFVELQTLADSSVNVVVRVWTKTSDFWDVHFDINKTVYQVFNEKGISFPFPQLTIHKSVD